MKKNPFARWRANFFTGLAIVLPAVVSIAVVVWLFGTVANITDTLLIFLPKDWTHKDLGAGTMHWYWSLVALLLAVLLIGLVCSLARYYFGKKLIQLVDLARSEEHTSELQSQSNLVCRLLLEKKKK